MIIKFYGHNLEMEEHGGVSNSDGQTLAHTFCVLERQAATQSSGYSTSQLHSSHQAIKPDPLPQSKPATAPL